MFRRIRWKLLATYLIVVSPTIVFLGVHLTRQFEAAYSERSEADLRDLARLLSAVALDGLGSGRPEVLRRQVQAVPPRADLAVFVTDAAGTVVASRGPAAPIPGVRAEGAAVANALRGEEVSGTGAVPGGGEAVYAAVPVRAGGRVLGAVYVLRPLTSLHGQIRHVRWVVAWATVVALAIAGGLALLLARSIAGPVQEMQVAASRLAAGHLDQRIPVRTRDELGDLARSLNYMASELARIDSLRRQFVADASHELRTPVANLAVAVEALKGMVSPDRGDAAVLVEAVEHEVGRLRRLVEDLLDLSLVESGEVRLNLLTVPPAEIIHRAVQPFYPRAEAGGIRLQVELPARLPSVRADPERTVQVLTNLLDNALKYTPPGGQVTVSASERRGHVLLGVADTGPGIPEADLPHIFDRFYKVDKSRTAARGGAGLGLAIAKRLVEAQGGIIMAENVEGRGARFLVALPRAG
ncbi:MAG: ATP-binding protein [Armatimonadota bacterium]|nr:ATP-binding protein [Armatimonadota bacterium]